MSKHPINEPLTHMMSHLLKMHRRTIDQLINEYDVYPGQPPLLLSLFVEDGLRQNELAARIHNKPATITVMIDRMEKTGLLERRPDPHDQRVTRVYLTDKGREVTIHVKEAIRTTDELTFANFLPEELMLFRRLLLQMQDNLRQTDSSN
ncbi:MarR family winged helix-turn-helix transcriptional regulator [Paenibacillus alba]|uniref:MarR family transcriptional regulator n=1 Tax=Paenibacillus alba TaxID=1197127 RepID=A0ABU6FZJ0_9BACL|nr:MarR family transcriptional regulator [Paenibacillus alba]MEC0227272.1 MarR family transcriptional regulator [Paenibacillus alba]NQX67605.1 MarR family transcriptional regulator [Paenibacillus alba]